MPPQLPPNFALLPRSLKVPAVCCQLSYEYCLTVRVSIRVLVEVAFHNYRYFFSSDGFDMKGFRRCRR